jgi:hypothetical protein
MMATNGNPDCSCSGCLTSRAWLQHNRFLLKLAKICLLNHNLYEFTMPVAKPLYISDAVEGFDFFDSEIVIGFVFAVGTDYRPIRHTRKNCYQNTAIRPMLSESAH